MLKATTILPQSAVSAKTSERASQKPNRRAREQAVAQETLFTVAGSTLPHAQQTHTCLTGRVLSAERKQESTMEVEQQPSQPSAMDPAMTETRVSPEAAVDGVSTGINSTLKIATTTAEKVVGVVDGEAVTIQPAVPTMLEASQLPPSPLPAPLSLSPVKLATINDSRHDIENGELHPTLNDDSSTPNGYYSKDNDWVDDTDAESGSSQPDDSRVAHFDFETGDGDDIDEQFDEEEPMKAASSLVVAEMKSEPSTQQSNGSNGVDDLISLPSPIANAAPKPTFDIFGASPVKQSNGTILHEQASPSANLTDELPDVAVLAPLMSALTVKASDLDEVSAQKDNISCGESQEQTAKPDMEAQDMQPSDEVMFAELSISPTVPEPMTARLDEPEPRESSPTLQQPSLSQASLLPLTAPQSVTAMESLSDHPDASSVRENSSPVVKLNSPTGHLQATANESSTNHRAASEAFANPTPGSNLSLSAQLLPSVSISSESAAPASQSPVKDETAVETQAAPSSDLVPAGSEGKPTSPSVESSKSKASPPKSSKDTVPRLQSKAPPLMKETKPKDAHITTRSPATTKAKSDGVKAKAPVPKTTLIKRKPQADEAGSSTASTVKSAPFKPKPERLSVSSKASERVTKVPVKSVAVPAGLSKLKSAAASTKEKLSSATPPPAPTAIESQGVPSIKKRLSSSELEAASNRLYANALESKKRKEVLKAELEESFTFTPQVNGSKRRSNTDDKNRFGLPHEKAQEAIKRKEDIKQKREKSECTFKPKITAKARKLSGKSPNPRYENLYKNAQEIRQKRDEKKNENDQKAVEECSFKPKIKTMKSPTKSRPLYDAERMKQKKLALEQKKIEAELSECTFKPKVVAKSTKAKGDDAGGKVAGEPKLFDRLYRASQKRAENLEKLRHEREEKEKSIATFQPKITSSHTGKGGNKQPFHERLYNKDHMQKVTADREQKKLEEEQKFTYKVS